MLSFWDDVDVGMVYLEDLDLPKNGSFIISVWGRRPGILKF